MPRYSSRKDYKKSVLKTAGWGEDAYKYPHSVSNTNEGFWKRLKNIAKVTEATHTINSYNSEGGHFLGSLGLDYNGTLVINGINIRLQYVLNDPEFFLFGRKRITENDVTVMNPLDRKFKYTIHKFVIHALVHELQPSIYEHIEYKLKSTPLVAGFKRYNMLQHTIPAGFTEWLSDNLLPS